MARDPQAVFEQLIGNQVIQIVNLKLKIEALEEELVQLKGKEAKDVETKGSNKK